MVQPSTIMFKCGETGCEFECKKKYNLLRHASTKHRKEDDGPQFICYHCNKNVSSKQGLIKHISKCNAALSEDKRVPPKLIKCPMCTYNHESKPEMLKHYHEVHGIDTSTEILKFSSLSEFEQWKEKFETQTVSKYKKQRGCKRTKKITKYYRCHRDGFFTSRGKNLRRMKLKGTNKINSYCPSKIDVCVSKDGEVTVELLKSHVGHGMDLERIPLSRAQRAYIAQSLSRMIPFDVVLNNIKESTSRSGELERIHLLNKKDLYNIKQLFNLKNDAGQPSDSASIDAWVKSTKENRCDSLVRYYKKQGQLDEYNTELKENDFLLIIMNDAQLEVLKRYGNNCICIDTTHGLKAHDYELSTVMVLDDLRQGFPCLFAFSNRSDKHVFKIVFKVIQNCLGYSLSPQVFMSDISDSFYNGWKMVMGSAQNRIYCSWHVLKAWDRNIKEKIKGKEKQSYTFDALRFILEKLDENEFERMLKTFMENSGKDPEMQSFHKYFFCDSKFVEKRKLWAYCYRKHKGIHTSMHFERMRQTLKYIYSKGNTGKRLDSAINDIMKMVQNKLFDMENIFNKGKLTAKLSSLRKRHKTIESLKGARISEEKCNQWICSSSDGTQLCTIEKTNIICPCYLKCPDCNACIHEYYCSCLDSAIKWNMCKHIHFLVQSVKVNNIYPTYRNDYPEQCDNNWNDYYLEAMQNSENSNSINVMEEFEDNGPKKLSNDIVPTQMTRDNELAHLEEFRMKLVESCQSIIFNQIQTVQDCEIFEKTLMTVSATIAAIRKQI